MYNIELYGVGNKIGKKLQNIAGLCYITKTDKNAPSVKDDEFKKRLIEQGNIFDLGRVQNVVAINKRQQFLSSTAKTKFFKDKLTLFSIHVNQVVSNVAKEKFVRMMRKHPLVLVIYLREK